MADTAFDPFPPGEGEVQLAQAPVPRSFDPWGDAPPAPAPQQQAPAPAPALQTNAPPTTPGVTQQHQAKPAWTDDDDKREAQGADQDENTKFSDPKNVLSHRNWRPLIPNDERSQKERVANHPMGPGWIKLNELLASGQMNKDEVRRYKAAAEQMRKTINADLNNEDKRVREQNQAELRHLDAPLQDVTKRDATAAAISTHLDTKAKETEALVNHRDPATAKQAKWDYSVSPLTTMAKKSSPDGKPNYVALRDAVTSIALINGLSNEKALDLTLAIGSPVGYDDKTGEWVKGGNGRRGAGATFYQPLGQDMNGNAVIRINNDTFRVPQATMAQLKEARKLGYAAAKKFRVDEEAAKQPGWVGQGLEWGARKLGLQ